MPEKLVGAIPTLRIFTVVTIIGLIIFGENRNLFLLKVLANPRIKNKN